MGDRNSHKMINSNETCVTVAISDLIISERIYFNLDQKPRFKKVLFFSRNASKLYNPPNINIKLQRSPRYYSWLEHAKELEHDKERSRDFKTVISWWQFYNIQNSYVENIGFRSNIPLAILLLFDCQGYLDDEGGKYGTFIC